jgi:hypothetical protein
VTVTPNHAMNYLEGHDPWPPTPCRDCAIDVIPMFGGSEWYMVHEEVWQYAGMPPGYLCIGCLEERIGRRLTPLDFTDAPINDPDPRDTERLASRKWLAR